MVSLKIILDKRTPKKDGTCPLKIRIIYNRQTYHMALGYSVLAEDWDSANQKVKKSSKSIGNVTRFNALIHKEKQKIFDGISKLDTDGQLESMSFAEIKKRISNSNAETMVLAYGEEVIALMKEANKHGNARVYDTMLRSVRDFVQGKDFPLKQVSYSWLKKYEAWYLSKGNSLNGMSVVLRTLRALFNRAIKEKRVSQDYYPFNDYKIKSQKTRKRAISQDDILKLKAFEPTTDRQKRAQDYFFISFYMMGASFVDIAFLKVSDIIKDRIEYTRKKTGQLHSIPLSPPLKTLLNPYLVNKEQDQFILNVIKDTTPEKQIISVRDELRRYNRSLKEIGKKCGIETPITSYVSRHTYATIAKFKGVPTAIISEALGHSSEEVTQIYLASFDKDVLDQYHHTIIED
ncbi:MAG: site-specific integrase [Bacteroidota bacterium]